MENKLQGTKHKLSISNEERDCEFDLLPMKHELSEIQMPNLERPIFTKEQ